MGSQSAVTYIRNIRTLLNEKLSDADIALPDAGTIYTNTELLEALNKSKNRYYQIIRSVRQDYFQTSGSLSLVAATKEYALAAAFREMVGLKCTTAGYENTIFRRVDQDQREFRESDAVPQADDIFDGELLYTIVGNASIKFANFPPAALAVTYDYIQFISDFTLSGSSTVDINDEHRDVVELQAAIYALQKDPKDGRLAAWEIRLRGDGKKKGLEELMMDAVAKRNKRESKHVSPYRPY